MPKPLVLSATEFVKNFGKYQRHVTAYDPVRVKSHGRFVGAYLSEKHFQEYEHLKQLQKQFYQSEPSLQKQASS